MRINGRMRVFLPVLIGIAGIGTTIAQTAPFDPMATRKTVAGPRTQVVVLGTSHLANLQGFSAASLSALLARLADFKPDVITIEG